MAISNNVFWNNGGTDLMTNGSGATNLANNDYGTLSGTWATDSNALHVDPGFLALGDFRLRADSPLRDAGDNDAVGGIGSWDAAGAMRLAVNSPLRDGGNNSPIGGTGSFDADGNPRVVFGTVDLGAYEIQDVIFKDGFD